MITVLAFIGGLWIGAAGAIFAIALGRAARDD